MPMVGSTRNFRPKVKTLDGSGASKYVEVRMCNSEPSKTLLKSVATIAVIGGAVAAFVIWARNPRLRTNRLIDRSNELLHELEHRAGFDGAMPETA